MLKKKFRSIHSNVLNNLLKKRYKIFDARNYREFSKYMLNIINNVKNANFHDVFN